MQASDISALEAKLKPIIENVGIYHDIVKMISAHQNLE